MEMAVYCSVCKKIYSTQSSLNKHLRRIHKKDTPNIISYNVSKYNSKCFECKSSFINVRMLREHLSQEHRYNFKISHHNFQTFEEFQSWLEDICNIENVSYVKQNGTKKKSEKSVTMYNCHRSITSDACHAVKFSMRKRIPKSQGTCKTNGMCTSQIKLTESNNKYEVIFYETHYNHEKEIQHLHISNSDRLKIANKLAIGVSSSRVLDDIICNAASEKDCLIRMKDINNIKNSFGITSLDGKRNKSDSTSITLWVEEQLKSSHSAVLFYKPQGVSHELFKDEDFCLIFMTRSQQFMLENFGKNIICIDSTHGLNSYDFQLTSVLVVDEYSEGFPGACMFSNREDTFVYSFFFSSIKQRIGHSIQAKTFMSDITQVFFNGWVEVMGYPEYQLYCSWHVDRAWQKNIKKIKNIEKRNWVYKTLKHLQYETEEVFLSKLENAVTLFLSDGDTSDFGQYFNNTYCKNYRLWALCYRKGCGINTNMYLESMHKVIKYTHLDGRVVRRLDKGLNAVLNYIKRKTCDRIQKKVKGKNTKKSRDILIRHKMAINLNLQIENMLNDTYIVSNGNTDTYKIKKQLDQKCCELFCQFCHICIHCYQCSCLDYLKRNTICKHIHFVVLNISKHFQINSKRTDTKAEINYFEVLDVNPMSQSNLKHKMISELNEMITKLETFTNECLMKQAYEYTKNANLLLSMDNSNIMHINCPTTSAQPANKKIEPQLTFTSTRKKKKQTNANNTLQKANTEENSVIDGVLKNKLYLSNCASHDHSYI